MPKTVNRKPKKQNKRTVILLTALVALIAFSALICSSCNTGEEAKEAPEICEHEFIHIASDSDREPDYGVEGRRYMVCTKCGLSMLEIIPALSLRPAREALDYIDLLEEYSFNEPMSYNEFASKYLFSCWSFKEPPDSADGEEDGGTSGEEAEGEEAEAMLRTGEYTMVFNSAYDGYESIEKTIKISVPA